MALSADDLDDALQLLRAAGRDGEQYRFEYVPYPRLGCGAGLPPADVIVTNVVTGARRIYRAGPGSNWLARFREQLASDVAF